MELSTVFIVNKHRVKRFRSLHTEDTYTTFLFSNSSCQLYHCVRFGILEPMSVDKFFRMMVTPGYQIGIFVLI